MNIETLTYTNSWKSTNQHNRLSKTADIIFIFGDRDVFKQERPYQELEALYPNAHIVGCSSSGNILGDQLSRASIVATAIHFEKATIKVGIEDFEKSDDKLEVGYSVVNQLPMENLKHIFILSEGLNINGSALAKGANMAVNHSIPITGGLAGDGMEFAQTWIAAGGSVRQNRVVAVGFYGEGISVSSGCYAGWDEFGIFRQITKSNKNIVYKIDGKPALELYKKYLGEYAKELPSSGLRFPFSIKKDNSSSTTIRSVLGIDESTQALIFAGDVPQGCMARLMRTDIDGLIIGAQLAADHIKQLNSQRALGLVVSCVGRRQVLKQLSDEELESISETLGEQVQLTGFYSYGELAPFSDELLSCHLHNQTMTLTVIYEEI